MKRSFICGVSFLLLIVLIAPSCKKDNVQGPELKKPDAVQNGTKVNGTAEAETKTQTNDFRAFKPKTSEPEPEPWMPTTMTLVEPEPEPWITRSEPEPEPWVVKK